MKHVFRDDQIESLMRLQDDPNPLGLQRFGKLTILTDKTRIAICSELVSGERLRILLLENFNPGSRQIGTYEDEAKAYSEVMKKIIPGLK